MITTDGISIADENEPKLVYNRVKGVARWVRGPHRAELAMVGKPGEKLYKKIIHLQIQIMSVPACIYEERKIATANMSHSASYNRR